MSFFLGDLKTKSRKFKALVIIIVVSASFAGYVCWSLVSWFGSVASFKDTLQKDGFTVIAASDFFGFRDFMFLPPEITIHCQNQAQFIYEARLANSTGEWDNVLYLLDSVHFYAIRIDNYTNEFLGYEYTPPLFRI
ncbi:MAG: hypothetical protein ABSG57_01955 [Candidatus Bathyarchaeia archaeon]|jgi:hypothetical protein